MGALYWQLNDIWPGISWALVDVDLHRKSSFYITKRALAHVVVGMERIATKEPPYITTGYKAERAALEIWAVNGHLEPLSAILKLAAYDIVTGKEVALLHASKKETKLTLKPNQTTEITRIDIPKPDTTVVVAYLDAGSGASSSPSSEHLARWISWPEPLKYLTFAPDMAVDLKVEAGSDGVDHVVMSSKTPLKGVVVSVAIEHGADAVFDDNFIDLVPGEEVRVGVHGLKGRPLQARWLCDWERGEDLSEIL